MTRVAILHHHTADAGKPYRALAGDKQSAGRTAGEALDALVTQLSEEDAGTIVVVRHPAEDRFFTAAQQRRLAELMDRWRTARDRGVALPGAEQAELDDLVEAELRGSAQRTAAALGESAP